MRNVILSVIVVAMLAVGGLSGCATLAEMQTVHAEQLDTAIAQAEQGIETARATLELYVSVARMAGKTEVEIAAVRDVWHQRIDLLESGLEELKRARDVWTPAR